MWKQLQTRHSMAGAVMLLYLLPMVLTVAYSLAIVPLRISWSLFTIGLLLAVAGTFVFFVLLRNWETAQPQLAESSEPLQQPDTPIIQENSGEELAQLEEEIVGLRDAHTQLLEEITYRNEELQKLSQERDLFQREAKKVEETYDHYRATAEEALEKEKMHVNELEETISELRAECDSKQSQVEQLENKIHDLTYEIKTLLHIADIDLTLEKEGGFAVQESAVQYNTFTESDKDEESPPSPPYVHDAGEAVSLLKRCVNIAQKITSSHHLNSPNSRFRDLALDNYALDLRRLCDSLSSESGGTVFVWSPKEGKLLFVNNQIKSLLGWSPNKLKKNVQEGIHEWKGEIARLSTMSQTQARLVLKSRAGQDHLMQCEMAKIPTGVFRNNVVGVLYSN
ncbi:MAG: hypothetical protein KDK72_06210 [Chlamydiia bacterium]|nr:hypothetical protein [Chlamydiia bacterium]